MPLYVKPNGTEILLNDTKASTHYADEHGWILSGVDVLPDINDMNKDELEKYALDRFNEDIDKRKSIRYLRVDVQAMIDGNS